MPVFDAQSCERISETVQRDERRARHEPPLPSNRAVVQSPEVRVCNITSTTVDGNGRYPAQLQSYNVAGDSWSNITEVRVEALSGTLATGRVAAIRVGNDGTYSVFAAAAALSTLSGSGMGGVTAEEVDGSPSYTSTTTLRFDQTDGFVLTQPSANVVRVDIAPSSQFGYGVVYGTERGADLTDSNLSQFTLFADSLWIRTVGVGNLTSYLRMGSTGQVALSCFANGVGDLPTQTVLIGGRARLSLASYDPGVPSDLGAFYFRSFTDISGTDANYPPAIFIETALTTYAQGQTTTIAGLSFTSGWLTGGSFTGYTSGGTDVPVADGGTGVSSFTPYAVICGGTTGTGALQDVGGLGTAGQVLTSNGAGALPSWQAAGGYTDEQAQDAVGTILTDSATIDFTYDDAANTITAIVKDTSITTSKIADANVTLAKLDNGSACSLVGRSANSGGVRADIAAASNNTFLARRSDALQFDTIAAADIPTFNNFGSETSLADTDAFPFYDASAAANRYVSGANLKAYASQYVQRVYSEYTTSAGLSTTIPLDDTVPQNTEGTEILTASITPRSATNRIRVRFQCYCAAGSGNYSIGALFVDSTASALAATITSGPTTNYILPMILEYEEAAGSTSARTYKIRLGANTGSVYVNGDSGGRKLGGAGRATLIVEEVQP